MVGRIPVAGDPGLARIHLQPAGLAGLQGQHGIDAQLAVMGTQHLQGAGGEQTGHGKSPVGEAQTSGSRPRSSARHRAWSNAEFPPH
jgi:hypothetical protein